MPPDEARLASAVVSAAEFCLEGSGWRAGPRLSVLPKVQAVAINVRTPES
jgi:hypothetical protein